MLIYLISKERGKKQNEKEEETTTAATKYTRVNKFFMKQHKKHTQIG